MRFEYLDADGQNEAGSEATIVVDASEATMYVGLDIAGEEVSYTVYIPNHREKILELISQLTDALDKTSDLPTGYDGFSSNAAGATSTGNVDEWSTDGEVTWY